MFSNTKIKYTFYTEKKSKKNLINNYYLSNYSSDYSNLVTINNI